jgi:hypothetical protein
MKMMEYGLEEWEFGREFGERWRCAVDNVCD